MALQFLRSGQFQGSLSSLFFSIFTEDTCLTRSWIASFYCCERSRPNMFAIITKVIVAYLSINSNVNIL